MKFSRLLVSIFLLLFTTQAFAQQEQLSDFEIQKQFKTQYQQFQSKIDTAANADSVQALIADINAFEIEYRPHADLLDKALYPNTFEQEIEELKNNARLAANRLQKYNEQEEQLTNMQLRLAAYQEHVYLLDENVDSLKRAMDASIQSERELSGMVRNYRQNLEERDELILSFIDSTVVAYGQMDLQTLKNLENVDRSKRLDSEGNALNMIRDISAENLNILKENSEKLRLEDFMRMQTVQQRFEDMWSKMGDKITNVYGGRNAEEVGKQVSTNIAQWDSLLNKNTFATISDSLQKQGLAISDFEDGEGFYNSLNSYLDKEIEQSKDGSSSEGYKHFQAFQDFWEQVESKWGSSFEEANIMSAAQMATISRKTNTWSQNAKPKSNMMLYLLIGTGLLALILGGLLIREKSKNKS